MSRNKARHTGPEIRLRKALWRRGLRYRLHGTMTGRPDVVFPGTRVAVFVDGCFWHGCEEHGVAPRNNATFWSNKISRNKQRDLAVTVRLQAEGWKVVRVWEHDIRKSVDIVADTISAVIAERSLLLGTQHQQPGL